MRTLLCLISVSVSNIAAAQELPKPGKAHELLARDAGTWDCDVKMFHAGPNAPPAESKAVEVNKLVSGDMYLLSTFTFEGQGGKFEGHGLMGYDPNRKQYLGTWVDNFTAAPSQFKGEYDGEKKILTVHSAAMDAAGNEMKTKQITTWTDDSHKKFEIFLLVEAGDQTVEVKLMEMTAKKRK